jgi:hypothetical protein
MAKSSFNEPRAKKRKAAKGLIKNPSIRETDKQFKVEDVRAWLTVNKIFFETVAATFLTFMAVILSYNQWRVAQDQTTYLEQQTRIEREQASPQFSITTKQDANSPNYDRIFVYNHGNIALNIITRTAVFFDLTYMGKNGSQKQLSVPIHGYYRLTIPSETAIGQVMIIESVAGIAKWGAIEKELDQLAAADGAFIDLSVKRYLELSYRDIFNETHVKYYNVIPFIGGDLLEPEMGTGIFDKFRQGGPEGIFFSIDEVSAQDLYNLFR